MNPHLRSRVTLPTHARFGFVSLVSATLLVCLLASATNVKAQQQGWSATGSLGTARYAHTATLLANGKVLVVGGVDGTIPCCRKTGSAELYDPATGQWSATGSLSTPRVGHIAVRLANGKVLVAGGNGGSEPSAYLTTAEIYDPDTGAWSAAGKLSIARGGPTATLLADGRVLVAGGSGAGFAFLNSAELYDPATGAWSPAGTMNSACHYHTATLLPDGKVLVASGYNSNSLQRSAELYDPATGSWTATSDLITARLGPTATLLPNGKVLAAGGALSDHCDGLYAPAELYDPATGQWSTTGRLTAPRAGHTATLLPNGKVLVAAGDRECNVLNSAELYDPATGSWSVTGSLITARAGHTATLLANGKVLVAGGNNYGNLNSAELFDSGDTLVLGESAIVAGGVVSTWARVNGQGKVIWVGLTIPMSMVENMPPRGTGPAGAVAVLNYPPVVQETTYFNHAEIQSSLSGHGANPAYADLHRYEHAHFDFHFYSIPVADVLTIPGGFFPLSNVPANRLPAGYAQPEARSVPQMGRHAAPLSEFTATDPWLLTMFAGFLPDASYMHFLEPMVTPKFLLRRKNFTLPVPMPTALGRETLYSTEFVAHYDRELDAFHFIYKGFDTPSLTLNSTKYCVGDSWNLKVTNAAPNAAIRLIGTSNGTSWEIPQWANTDANGNFSTTGIFNTDAVGSHTVRVEISGFLSGTLPVEVVNCGQSVVSSNTNLILDRFIRRIGHPATVGRETALAFRLKADGTPQFEPAVSSTIGGASSEVLFAGEDVDVPLFATSTGARLAILATRLAEG